MKIIQYKEVTIPIRESVTCQSKKFRKKVSCTAATHIERSGTSILETKPNSPKLIRRKSKDTYLFKGWEITDDDFPDF